MSALSYLLVVLFWSQLVRFGSDAVRIYINPAKSIANMLETIHISCIPESLDDDVKGVTLMGISRNDQDPLVYISQCGNVSFGEDFSRFQAVASIGTDPSQSYLNASLRYPESDDTGIYTCSLYYIDKSGHMKMETASENLLIESIDVKSLERVINRIGEKITSYGEESTKNTEMVMSLVDRITSLEKENKDLKEKVFYNVAFMATTMKEITPSSGAVIILPDIIWSTGTGYDNQTGVFTAPVPGLYAFQALVKSRYDYHLYVDLMVDGKRLSRMYNYDKESNPQNSISCVVNLQVGDNVFIQLRDGYNCRLYGDIQTVFTGYLIKAF